MPGARKIYTYTYLSSVALDKTICKQRAPFYAAILFYVTPFFYSNDVRVFTGPFIWPGNLFPYFALPTLLTLMTDQLHS